MPSEHSDVVIVGSGVLGLSVAEEAREETRCHSGTGGRMRLTGRSGGGQSHEWSNEGESLSIPGARKEEREDLLSIIFEVFLLCLFLFAIAI
jgi:glycine/D-amino acid oxidase-like deaminating enzyme